ncbi:MAG: hypothetical protein AVDCRST_MAG54-3626, partial [uncultured Actinomycetospora sp.]
RAATSSSTPSTGRGCGRSWTSSSTRTPGPSPAG